MSRMLCGSLQVMLERMPAGGKIVDSRLHHGVEVVTSPLDTLREVGEGREGECQVCRHEACCGKGNELPSILGQGVCRGGDERKDEAIEKAAYGTEAEREGEADPAVEIQGNVAVVPPAGMEELLQDPGCRVLEDGASCCRCQKDLPPHRILRPFRQD